LAATLQLTPLVFARQRGGAGAYAFPVAAPDLMARGHDVDDAIETLRRFLGPHLTKLPADRLAAFLYPRDVELRDVPVCLPRPDLPRRIMVTSPVAAACVVIPDGGARWVHVVALRHTIYVPEEVSADEGDLSRRIIADIERLAAARELSPDEYLTVLPGDRHVLQTVQVEVTRDDLGDVGRRAGDRRRAESDKQKEAARKLLASIGTDLLAEGTKLPPVLHRDRDVRVLGGMLGGDERLCVALVGERRAGKTAVLDGLLSQRIVPFRAHPVFATSGAQLVAGQSGFGQLTQRVHDVMAAAESLDAVIYFDDLGDLLAGHSGSIEDMASAMRPYIVEGRVRVVGELTPEQLEHFEKRQVGLFAALHRINIEPLDETQTRDVLTARARHLRQTQPHRPALAGDAVGPLVTLAARYLSYEAFPGKAVRLADELRAIHEGEVDESGAAIRIGPTQVYAAFAVRSGIPTFLLRDDRAMQRQQVVDFFARGVIGQSDAIARVVDTLCTVKAGLQPPAKPLATFLFIGPTGVGKTEVAKTLARFLFGSADRLVRFDMSEYMDPLAAERLIRGSERDEGELTRRVRQQPFCVVLLDEIEKAHRAVFDLLLQVCGEGRLSDARGRTTYFHNAIIIMTSNLGAALRRPAAGFGGEPDAASDASYWLEQVQRSFRPEFVNRLDRVIPFAGLDRAQIRQVARVALQRLTGRDGLAMRGISLAVSDEALDVLAEAGFSAQYGARALRRHLEDALVAPLAAQLAALGSEAERASIEVVTAAEPAPTPAAGTVGLVDHVAGPVRISIRRPETAATRDTSYALRFVGHLRREARRCAALPPLATMRERRDYLVAELARPSSGGGADVARSAADFDRLQRLLAGVDDAVTALETAEELCVAAQAETEDPSAYVAEAERAFAQLEQAWVAAVLGRKPLDQVSLVVRPLGGEGARQRLRQWLEGWLGYAADRGWEVVLHRFEDPLTDATWLPGLSWGPPRTRAWTLQALREADDDALAKQWRAVVVRVRGSQAFGVLAQELGLHRFRLDADVEHVEVRVVHPTFAIEETSWRGERLALPKAPPPATTAKAVAVREFLADGTTQLPALGQVLDVAWPDYWTHLSRVHFSLLCERVARDDDDGDD
jgi:ATP-dependent Clp protease ATP-binding subunit ClpC